MLTAMGEYDRGGNPREGLADECLEGEREEAETERETEGESETERETEGESGCLLLLWEADELEELLSALRMVRGRRGCGGADPRTDGAPRCGEGEMRKGERAEGEVGRGAV